MFVFWWTGKGYLTPIILFVSLMVFGLILQAGQPLFSDTPWFWGIALVAAGIVNWIIGRRQNARKIAAVRSTRFRDTLIYRARNKFMSLPFEFWSIPLVIGGVGLIGYGMIVS